jgi:hypothetical protein
MTVGRRGADRSSSTQRSAASPVTSTSVNPPRQHVPNHRGNGLAGLDQVVRHVGDQVGALGWLHDERIREAGDVDAVQRAHAVGPVHRQPEAVAAGHVIPGPFMVGGANLEAGGEDDAVDRVLPAGRHHAGLRDSLDSLAVGVDQVRTWEVGRPGAYLGG